MMRAEQALRLIARHFTDRCAGFGARALLRVDFAHSFLAELEAGKTNGW